jgi:nitrogen fixation protein NifU and related proteins
MSRPSSIVLEHLDRPRNAGPLEDPDAVGHSSLNGRAPYTHISVKLQGGRVEQIGFQTFGCSHSISACSVATELARGNTIDRCLAITADDIVAFLGVVPEEKRFCVELALQALHDALRQAQDSPREGEEKSRLT